MTDNRMTDRSDVFEQKRRMREEMSARRNAMNEAERARAAWSMCHRISSFLEARDERTIGVYLSRPFEISLDNLIANLLQAGYEIAAPRVDLSRGEMTFWRLESLESVEIGPYHVREPISTQPIENLPLILVPGLAFDRAGGRLGTGGGWYDRVLGEIPLKIGVGFDCQIAPRVPLEPHDVAMNFFASEARFLSFETPAENGDSQN